MRPRSWICLIVVPTLLVAATASAAPTPRAAKQRSSNKTAPKAAAKTARPAKPTKEPTYPPMPVVNFAELEAAHERAAGEITRAMELQADAKKAKEAQPLFQSGVKQLEEIHQQVELLARAHAGKAKELELEANAKTGKVPDSADVNAKREAIAAATIARQQALQQDLLARQLQTSANRQKDALATVTAGVKDNKPEHIRAASSAFAFELRRVVTALNPTPTPTT